MDVIAVQVPQAVASGLTVRVINNITKKLDVKQRFLETFKNDGFPTQFQYKQKVGPASKQCDWAAMPHPCAACSPQLDILWQSLWQSLQRRTKSVGESGLRLAPSGGRL